MFHPVPNWVKEGCIHIAENGVPKMWGFWNPVVVSHESLQLSWAADHLRQLYVPLVLHRKCTYERAKKRK